MRLGARLGIYGVMTAVLAVGGAQSVAAQCLLCDAPAPQVALESPIRDAERPLRVEIVADLNFSRMVVGSSGGNIALDPASGRSQASGDVQLVSGMGFSGRIHIEGTPGRAVRIDLPEQVVLSAVNGGRVTVTDIHTGQPPVVRIGPDGRLDLALGGRLIVFGPVDGEFRGRIPVTVSYE